MRGIAVIEHDRAAGDQRREQQVPHHPAGGAVAKHPRIGAKIQMKMQQLQLLQQRAAVTMDDDLGHASGAGRDHPPKRMTRRNKNGSATGKDRWFQGVEVSGEAEYVKKK